MSSGRKTTGLVWNLKKNNLNTIMKKETISFATNATTLEALKLSALYAWVFIRNIGQAVNRFVHRFPWACIIAVIAISTMICCIKIGNARAERDYYNHQNVKLSQKVASYEAVFSK
jgi:hypothetical protein